MLLREKLPLILWILCFLVISYPKILQAQQQILTLEEALNMARSTSSLSTQYEYAREAAHQGILLQKAEYWPTLQFRANVSHANEAPRIPVEFAGDTVLARQGTQDTFISRFELNQTVYDFGKTKHAVDASRMQALSVDAQFNQQMTILENDVRSSYYQSIYYHKLDSIYSEIIPFSKELAQINEVRLKNGVALAPDFLQAQIDLQNLMANQTSAQNEYRKALVQIAFLTGQKQVNFDTEGELPEFKDHRDLKELYPQLYRLALEHRSDIRQVAYQSDRQAAVYRSIDALRYPSFILQSDFSYFGPDAFGYYSGLSSRGLNPVNWRVGIGFTYTLFDGFNLRSQKNQALALQKQYRERAFELENQASTQIQRLLTNLENLNMLEQTNKLLIEQIELNIAIAKKSLDEGNIPRMEYIKAVIPKVSAEAALQKTRFDIAQTLVELETAVGTDISQIWAMFNETGN